MKSILFVDDSAFVLDSIRRMLSEMTDWWNMEFAADGPTALKILGDRSFDILVTDLKMPGMDGEEVIRRAKEIAPDIACFVMSGDMDEYAEDAMEYERQGYGIVEKPCTCEALKERISGVLNI